jgi:hypothetical protein
MTAEPDEAAQGQSHDCGTMHPGQVGISGGTSACGAARPHLDTSWPTANGRPLCAAATTWLPCSKSNVPNRTVIKKKRRQQTALITKASETSPAAPCARGSFLAGSIG